MTGHAVQTVPLPTPFDEPLVAPFDTSHRGSDGGAILLSTIDELGFTTRLAACLPERRQAGKTEHGLPTLVWRGCYGPGPRLRQSQGSPRLRADRIHKLLVGRNSVAGDPLASESALSRFESVVTARDPS